MIHLATSIRFNKTICIKLETRYNVDMIDKSEKFILECNCISLWSLSEIAKKALFSSRLGFRQIKT